MTVVDVELVVRLVGALLVLVVAVMLDRVDPGR